MNKELIKQIIRTRNSIREKHKAFKRGRIDTQMQLEEIFKPITGPLKEFAFRGKLEAKDKIKLEPKQEEKEEEDIDDLSTSPKHKYLKVEAASTPLNSRECSILTEDEFATPTHSRTLDEKGNSTLNASGYMISEYFKMYANNSPKIDYTYGVYIDDDNKWKIGNSVFEVIGDNISIKGKTYNTTLGLCELLFMKEPVKSLYTGEDLVNYQAILKDTSAYKRDFDEGGQIKGSKGSKYKEIISKLIQHKGMGLMQLPRENIDYVYWDDPNELIERLRLLVASLQAGDNSHVNEIVSIIEELREAEIIQ